MKLIAKIAVESEVFESERDELIKRSDDKKVLEMVRGEIADILLVQDGREESIDIQIEFVE